MAERSLVIGANGFLGSSLVDELVRRGHEVTAFDRFTRASALPESVTPVVGDFLDADAVATAVAGHTHVFHFLSTTTPASADGDPVRDARENVVPSIHLLEACVAAGVEKVYFASTGGAIYGDHGEDAMSETVRPQPVSPYAIGKLAIEGYLSYFSRKHGLQSASYRISNPYGPRQLVGRSHGVIPTFLRLVREGRPVQVFGDGSSVRDYVYVEDAVRMIVDTVGRDTDHATYNIGSGVGTSLTELLGVVEAVTGAAPLVEYRPEPPTFVHRSVLDTSRYAAEFGAPSLRSLEQGVNQTWEQTA
ncbi:NAD-dependent epimerase/dehydratase family protein [soil metagenome]